MVCACSTCHIYLESGDEHVPEITDREEDFIDRARNPRILEPGAGDITVTIPDQSLLHGE